MRIGLGHLGTKISIAVAVALSGVVWLAGQNRSPRGSGEGQRGPGQRPPQMEKIDLPEPEVKIYVEGEYRYIESNGIPDHDHGEFPTRGNPNAIRPQQHRLKVPLNPAIADEPTISQGGIFGVALNGIPFEPGTAERYQNNPQSNWHYEALTGHLNLGIDQSNAHVQPSGSYHYHGLPIGLILNSGDSNGMVLVGYAADGFPLYTNYGYNEVGDSESGLKKMQSSWSLKKGTRPEGPDGPGEAYDGRFTQDWEYREGSGDLDEFNGRLGPTPEYPDGIYHYYVTEQFPYVSRMFKGTPDDSFKRRRGGGRGGPEGPRGRGERRGPRPGGPRGEGPPRGAPPR